MAHVANHIFCAMLLPLQTDKIGSMIRVLEGWCVFGLKR